MINNVEQYLAELKKALSGSDRATIQDALADAEEYLRTALESASGRPAAEAFGDIMAKYGAPAEVAAAYRELEARTPPAFTRPTYVKPEPPAPAAAATTPASRRPFYLKVFGVFAEARAWGAFFYLLISLATGIVYFAWAVTGLSLSTGLAVLVVGMPFLFLFLLSVRGLALMEGRLVEALLGVRMPRRQIFTRRCLGFWQKLKGLLTHSQTWMALVYMIVHLPLGVIYFSVVISLAATSLWLIGRPVMEMYLPAFTNPPYDYYTPTWLMPFAVIGGVLLLTATLHLAKLTGKVHGLLAKAMLVRE